jgi:chromosome segregation ATPase
MNALEVEEKIPVTTNVSKDAIVRYALLTVAAIYVILSLYLIFNTRTRLASLAAAQKAATSDLQQRQAATDNNLKITSEAFANQLGLTERQLQASYAGAAAQLHQRQQAFERRVQVQQNELAGQVTDQVADVRTELGGAEKQIASTRTDLESTRTDLESTTVKLDRAIGDLTGQSSLIARTREELEELKHRGDRNYYEFTLYKGEHPTEISTVALQLKKADAKKSKFTLNAGMY